ncbi:TonB-linked SusC/RagA family outer membrane protein [Flavobacterium sp. 90]|uniref:SusC/RagA family TonB-linked outer membrane protein n=1 Tax=unclassified Flavobacterium TaxID=196869 RepID=UPI000EACE4D9|nr:MULTISPECIES: TonB-dependent receptor [unclassified Flavobacterium]RKR04714.1 TonB-linked SusC/RagA family outer membrane protein [Flavobacterium sp. 81]TCK56038.1 TonB-linked SusC/RagA family outer membrane protein [Flavobacterium sp. 90]
MNIKQLSKKKIKYNLVFLFFLNFLLSTTMNAQSTVVEGKITDAAGLSLPGVNIQEKGTKNGTSTDFEGSFKINVTNNKAVLIVTYLGFQTQEVSVAGKSRVNVSLSEQSNSLNEVVVVGYGSVKKTDLTGAVNTLSAAKITERNVTNPMEAIQGGIAGVQVTSNSGRIGDGFNVIIRGTNSINKDGSKPLFVVDGVPTDNIDFLNPQDIARMDVLKDASSAAIYGSRGGSGVIIVTTKSGTNAKAGVTVTYDSSYGNKQAVRLPKLMSPEKWWYYHQSAFLATSISATNPTYNDIDPTELRTAVGQAGTNPVLFNRVANNQSYNWQDAVLKGGMTQNNYLNVSGRADNGLSYNIGLGAQKETGVIDNEGIDKYNFKAGLNHKINDKISFGVNLTISKTDEQLGSGTAMQEAFRQNPYTSPWAIDANGNEIVGTYAQQPGTLRYPNGTLGINKTGSYNPLLEIANSSDEIKRFTTIGNLFGEYKFTNWLSFKSTFSAGSMNAREGRSLGAQTDFGLKNKSLPSGDVTNVQNFNYTWDNQFNINYTLKENHVFNVLLLQSFYSNTTETYFQSSRENPFETGFYNLGSGAQPTYNLTPSGSIAIIPSGVFIPYSKNTLESYAARLNYTYKGRYLLTASVRYDGSSVLADGNKWTAFPSVALGWNINQESFLKNVSFISNLKLRGSVGYTGNDNVSPYSSLSVLKVPTYYDFNGTPANGFTSSSLGNTNLTWEKTREVNLGLDFGFAKNRISGSVDVYDRLSKDLLFQQALPLEIGVPTITSNVGSISNKGIEVALVTKNIQTRNVSWETSFTFTKNVNKLESIYGQDKVDDVGNNLFIGENIHSYYNYVFDGVWQESEAAKALSYGQKPGEARVKDLNNDGKIDANNDRAILGNYDPKWSGSFSTTLKVKQFDLSMSLITNQGMTVFSGFHDNFADVTDRGRQKLDLKDWYIPANGAGIAPQYSNTNPLPRGAGVYYDTNNVAFYKNASFVKVQNIAVGYSLDNDLVNKLKIKSMRFYVNVLNPFVITPYEGYDPEWATAALAVNRVSTMTVQMGLSLKF